MPERARLPSDPRAFLARVLELSGSNPAAAARLARRWREYEAEDRARALRARAVGERCAGRWAESAETLALAAAASKDPVERLSLQIGRVDSLARAGQAEAAVRLGRRLARRLDAAGQPAQAARARLNLGNALLWQDRYREARAVLARALPLLVGAERLAAKLALSTAELFGGSAERAGRDAAEARAGFERAGLAYFAALARLNEGYAAWLGGDAESALQALRACHESLEGADQARAAELLADVYRSCGLLEEAEGMYLAALPSSGPLNRANVRYGLGLVALGLGRADEARAHFRAAARAYRRLQNEVWAAAARLQAARCSPRPGQRMRRAVQELERSGSRRLAAEGEVELLWAGSSRRRPAQHELDACRARLAKAGGSVEAWKLDWLEVLGSAGPARLEAARRAVDSIEAARSLLRSPVVQAAFLRGRSFVVAELAALLVESGRAAEALEVVRRHRALGLTAGPGLAEGAATVSAALAGRPAGRELSRHEASRLQSLWASALVSARSGARPSGARLADLVFVERDEGLLVLGPEPTAGVPVARPERARRLRRFRFELGGAAAGGAVDVERAQRALDDLRELAPGQVGGKSLCLEGALWTVPWGALASPGPEPVLALAPEHPELPPGLPSPPRVLLWAGEAPDLPFAAREARLVMERFPGAVVCRTAAEAAASLVEGEYDLFHVTAHARSHPENPLFSSVQFSDGAVYAYEVLGARARVGAAVLSACEAGAVGARAAFEPEGLGRAFLGLGAKVVVGPVWPVDDHAALLYVESLYEGLASGLGWLGACAVARQAVREQKPHPYFWAPFATLGGYRQ